MQGSERVKRRRLAWCVGPAPRAWSCARNRSMQSTAALDRREAELPRMSWVKRKLGRQSWQRTLHAEHRSRARSRTTRSAQPR